MATDRGVRFTLDLRREQHRFLKRYAFELEVNASAVLRTLLSLLEEEASLAERVQARLAAAERTERSVI